MAYYLLQATYSQEARTGMINNPHNREPEVRKVVEGLGRQPGELLVFVWGV